jgi:Ca2+/Na+ antiporter
MGLPPSTICHPGSEGGFFLPLFGNEVEDGWPRGLRAALYLAGLLYAFVGVGELSDVFMEAIEVITSAEREVASTDAQGRRTVAKQRVWNGTVASLSLMALGSSAPEILLNIVEVVGNGFNAGDLGPSTIVGSAAYNFLVIIAVCIVAIPRGEQRRIRSFATFLVTTAFSLFAYGWMYVAIALWTPDVITRAEAGVTLGCLPLLVYVAYRADIGAFGGNDAVDADADDAGAAGRAARESLALGGGKFDTSARESDRLAEQMARVRETFDPRGEMSEQQIADIAARDLGLTQPRSYAYYRSTSSGGGPRPRRPAAKRVVRALVRSVRAVVGRSAERPVGGTNAAPPPAAAGWLGCCGAGAPPRAEPALLGAAAARSDGAGAHAMAEAGGRTAGLVAVAVEVDADDGDAPPASGLRAAWAARIARAATLRAPADEETGEPPSALEAAVHVASAPWRLLGALLVPPPAAGGGWPAFGAALVAIGFTTAVIADLAGILGCVAGVADPITALTLVALGTSIPDTFASKIAAESEPTADSSITNVTGSNSVNVFVGLGVPWLFASAYWAAHGATEEWASRYPDVAARLPAGEAAYVLRGGDLGFSVGAFFVVCLLGVGLLFYRRYALGAELGGPARSRYASAAALVGLWLAFVSLVCCKFAGLV